MWSPEELKDIQTRLELEAMGVPVDRPVTEREIQALQERINWEQANMGFFNGHISFKQAKLLNLLEQDHDQIIMWGGNRSQKTNTQCLMAILLATGFWPVDYTEVILEDGQRCLKPVYELRQKPIVEVPCDIGISLLNRELQKKPQAFETTLEAMIPKSWIYHKRRVADYTEYIQLKNGSKFWFMSAASGADAYQSAVFRVVIMDEAHEEKVFNELTSRIGKTPPMVIMGFYTGARGKDWAYDLFVKNEELGKTPPNRVVERMTMLDNPFIPQKAKEKAIEMWKERGELERRLFGGVDDLTGIVYKKFSKQEHVVNPMDIPEFIGGEPPKDWPIISGLDCHHTEKGCAASWIAINPDNGRCYLFHEYESTDEPSVWIDDLNAINEKYPSIVCEADPSMDSTDNRGYNLWNEFRRKCTLPLHKATRDHAQGIHAVTEALAPLRDAIGNKIDEKPGLYICDHCVRTIEQIMGYHRKAGSAVNEVVKKDDEFCDTLRYMMVTRPAEQFIAVPQSKTEKQSLRREGEKRRGSFLYSGRPEIQTDKPERKGAFIYAPPK